MRQLNPNELRELAADIDLELQRLQQLESAIVNVAVEIQRDSMSFNVKLP
jgi:hypothetical protein